MCGDVHVSAVHVYKDTCGGQRPTSCHSSVMVHFVFVLFFFKAAFSFCVAIPPPTEVSPLYLVCLVLVSDTALIDLEFKDPPVPQFWGHKHTPPYLVFSMGFGEQTPFFIFAKEAHSQHSHLPVQHCFFLASLFRITKSYLAPRRKTTTIKTTTKKSLIHLSSISCQNNLIGH